MLTGKQALIGRVLGLTLILAAMSGGQAAKGEPLYTIVVSAPRRDYREVPVSLVLPAPQTGVPVLQRGPKQFVLCQAENLGERVKVWWLVRDLKRGEAQTFQLTFKEVVASSGPPGVEVKRGEGMVEVTIDGQLFTRYVFTGAPKPYCYPLIGPTGKPMTRGFPMERVEGESQDHPHHRSFWFTQDEVNGVNFWGEGPRNGQQVHREFEALEGGPVFGLIRARNDWVKPNGTKVCEDVRELRVYRVATGRLFDFEATIRATEGPITIGDTKEGLLGFRVAATMRVDRGRGHILNARGQRDREAWGKRAEWCDYFGPVDGKVVGIAVFDHPGNLRHPTYWHVRTYGLFAANPFGLRHFIGDQTGAGKYTLPAGEALTFRYRIFLHRGDPQQARVAEVYGEYTDPPRVEVR
ncbi:MAG TPA: hypothetical protein EYP85_06645 [Armatimonadetes bacterium]|nr:hypothetical protein [Armatimonadota bacterium]